MHPHPPEVSIVIPCRGHAIELERCLRSLLAQQFDGEVEIIVVDAGLDDAVLSSTRRLCVQAVRGPGPLLPGQARNLGAHNARAEYLCFVDADCVAECGWLTAAVNALRNGVRVVGGPVLQGEPWHLVATIDNLMQFVDLPKSRKSGPIELLPSCSLGISREDFFASGGYPEVDFPAGEDVLFSRQVFERWGKSLRFEQAMCVRHFGRRTLRELWFHQLAFGYARARFGLKLTMTYRRLGRTAILAPIVGFRRIGYIAIRALQWNPGSLFTLVLGFPVLVFGMAAWCRGFHQGSLVPPAEWPFKSPGSAT